MPSILQLLVVEDNPRLQPALSEGLDATGEIHVIHACDSGEAALEFCLAQDVDAALAPSSLAARRQR